MKIKFTIRSIFMALLVLCSASEVFSQSNTGFIRGVLSYKNEPVSGAIVELYNENWEKVKTLNSGGWLLP